VTIKEVSFYKLVVNIHVRDLICEVISFLLY